VSLELTPFARCGRSAERPPTPAPTVTLLSSPRPDDYEVVTPRRAVEIYAEPQMVIGLTVYFALSLLATIVGFSASILGSRADRWTEAAVQQMSERQLSGTYPSGDERERAAVS
jgi:hypothetical protein